MPFSLFRLIGRKLIFVSEAHEQSIHLVDSVKYRLGAGGMLANKGSTSIRFNYDDTTFLFLNCHLVAGDNQNVERLKQMK
jgi:hypothetical protein